MNNRVEELLKDLEEIALCNDEDKLEELLNCFDYKQTSIPFVNESIMNQFMSKLKYELEKYINNDYYYNEKYFNDFMKQNSQITHDLSLSRVISHNIKKLLSSENIIRNVPFCEMMRDIEKNCLKCDLEKVKKYKEALPENLKTDITGLSANLNMVLLQGDISEITIQQNMNNFAKKQVELQEKMKNGEINAIQYSQENKVLMLQFETASMQLDAHKKFTYIQFRTIDNQINNKAGLEPNFDHQEILYDNKELEKMNAEIELKGYEILFASGDMSIEEYLQEKTEIMQKIEKIERFQSTHYTNNSQVKTH